MNATMTNNSSGGVILAWLTILAFAAFCACGVVVVLSQHAQISHANEEVNADNLIKWITAGSCKPVPYWCEDNTVKVLCALPGQQLPAILVLSSRGYSLEQFVSGDIEKVVVVTGFQPETQNYVRNTTRNCQRIDLPWLMP